MLFTAALPLAALAVTAVGAAAQDNGQQSSSADWVARCQRGDSGWGNNRGSVHCEVREARLAATGGTISVDARENGGVSVRGWDRNEVLVQERIQTRGTSDADARAIAQQIRVETGGSRVHATGPRTDRNRQWSVSYEVFVPRRSNLALVTTNGPIALRDVSGDVRMDATNGPMTVSGVSGNVRGRTTNGPLRVELSGARWSGSGLDLETTNGPVTLSMPPRFAAHLEAGTTNGPMRVDFSVTVQGRINSRISSDINGGGPTIRVVTTNGPVSIRTAGAAGTM
jgi:DUF4097 and DUF4098 domain-containing protein YvlB